MIRVDERERDESAYYLEVAQTVVEIFLHGAAGGALR